MLTVCKKTAFFQYSRKARMANFDIPVMAKDCKNNNAAI